MSRDFVTEHADLEVRVRNIETGAFKPYGTIGGFGRNTNWHTCSLRSAWKASADSKVEWRVRSDRVYFRTTGLGITVPTPVGDAPLMRLGKAARPSRTSHIEGFGTTAGCRLRVEPNGNVFWVAGVTTFKLGQGYSLG